MALKLCRESYMFFAVVSFIANMANKGFKELLITHM